ncbi:protein FAM184A-like [Saccoglossus kowalevskii]
MAAKMSFNYYQHGKYGTLPQNGQANMDVTPDLHLKMSKKIAQLTKVIYALNTKNDEHEQVLQSMKEHHEEDMQQLMVEAKDKIAMYKSKINNDTDQKRRMETLEDSISEYERQRRQALGEFNDYKRRAEDREMHLKIEHSQKILNLSKELLQVKKDFEAKLNYFQEMQVKFNSDKNAALDDLKKAHAKEIDELLKAQHMHHTDLSTEKESIHKQYREQISELENKYEQLNQAKSQMCEDYEDKLKKAQAFYEKELAVLKEHDQKKIIEEYQERERIMKREFGQKEQHLTRKVEELANQLELSESDLERLKHQLSETEGYLESKESDSSALSQQLAYAKQESMVAMTRLKQVESELIASKEMCSQQAKDLLKKSSMLGTLEATKISNEATIQDQQSELFKIKDRLSWLENERKSLENKSQTLADQQGGQVRALEKALEKLSSEKDDMRENYEKQIASIKQVTKDNLEKLQTEHKFKLSELIKEHQEKMESIQRENKEQLESLKQESEKKLSEEKDRLTNEKEKIQEELDKVRSELTYKLKMAEDEISRLQKLVAESEDGLGSAGSHINSLKTANNELQAQLENTTAELRVKKNEAATLQADIMKLRKDHNNVMESVRKDTKFKLEQLSKELDSKWAETLRKECNKLRMELIEQHNEDKAAALQQLSLMKNQEMDAARQGWQVKVEDLLKEISMLKMNLTERNQEASDETQRLRREMDEEIRRIRKEMDDSIEEYTKRISAIEAANVAERNRLEDEKQVELQNLEEKMKKIHEDELMSQILNNNLAIERTKEEAETQKMLDIDSLKMEHQQYCEKIKSDFSKRHMGELDQLTRAHKTQMGAVKMELERALELKQRQETDYQDKIHDLQDDLRHRERHIDNVEAEIREIKVDIDQLNKEIEFKGQEILRIKSATNNQLRKQENELAKKHQKHLDNLAAEHLRETQSMLGEFNRAQELLKDKISALQIM